MNTKNKKNLRQVYVEDSLWELLGRLSLLYGCTSHPQKGSASEALRRFAKTAILQKRPNLKNIENVDWNEIYI